MMSKCIRDRQHRLSLYLMAINSGWLAPFFFSFSFLSSQFFGILVFCFPPSLKEHILQNSVPSIPSINQFITCHAMPSCPPPHTHTKPPFSFSLFRLLPQFRRRRPLSIIHISLFHIYRPQSCSDRICKSEENRGERDEFE